MLNINNDSNNNNLNIYLNNSKKEIQKESELRACGLLAYALRRCARVAYIRLKELSSLCEARDLFIILFRISKLKSTKKLLISL
jgi:hypothetical protein